jgi:CHAT domain-containing protein/tetratricopeptide (TPR) repeat protein
MHKLFYFLITILFFVACKNIKSTGHKKFIAINIDSAIQKINIDSNKSNRFIALNELLNANNFDTFALANINLNLFLNDTTTSIQKYKHLDFCIENEKNINTNNLGKTILGKTFAYHYYYYWLKGDFKNLKNDCEKYLLYTNDSLDLQFKSSLLIQLGNAYQRIGDSKKAIDLLQKALDFSIKTSNDNNSITASVALANSLNINGNADNANEILKNAINFKNISSIEKDYLTYSIINAEADQEKKIRQLKLLVIKTENIYVLNSGLNEICNFYEQKHNYALAIKYLQEALQIKEQELRTFSKRCLSIGDCFLQLNKLDSSIYYYDKGLKLVTPTTIVNGFALPIFDSLSTENTIFDICIAKADLILTSKTTDTTKLNYAIATLLAAQKVAELIRKEIIFDESKYGWGIDIKNVSERLLQCYLLLYTKTKNNIYAQLAFMVAENSKATALQDNVERNILAYEQADTNYARFINLRKQLNNIEVQQLHATTDEQKSKLKDEYNKITMQLGIYKSLSSASLQENNKALLFEDINAYLAKNNFNAMSYFVGSENIYLLFVNAETKKVQFAKCYTSLLDSVQTLCNMQNQQNIYDIQQSRFVLLSNYVYKNMFGNIAILNNNKTTIVLADDVLNNLAFDALITNAQKPNSFLIKQNRMSLAYSIRGLMSQEQRPYANSNSVLLLAPFTNINIRYLPQLEGSKIETGLISRMFLDNCLLDSSATFQNFENNLFGNKYIHIASHATAGETPRLEFYDSSVLINSIYQMPMQQSFAYLNTCQSGSGVNYYSEGNLSLGRAFYSNGVHNVALTFWNMNDASSSELSTLFYKNLKENNNSIYAMHEAKLAYLKSQPMDKQAPYYWASVQHIGDGIIDEKKSKLWYYVVAGLLLLGLPIFFKVNGKTFNIQ